MDEYTEDKQEKNMDSERYDIRRRSLEKFGERIDFTVSSRHFVDLERTPYLL